MNWKPMSLELVSLRAQRPEFKRRELKARCLNALEVSILDLWVLMLTQMERP